MSDVSIASQHLNFVIENIFNVINNDPSKKDVIASKIKSGTLKVPLDLKNFVFKYLGIVPKPNRSRLSGERLHEYLIQRMSIQNSEKIKFPMYSTRNIHELMKFLKEDGQSLLKFNEQTSFYNQCRFGYILVKLFYLHRGETSKKRDSRAILCIPR